MNMARLDKQINYWAHMLDESFGDQSNVPQYTGKLDGYKWVYCMESNIEESQFLKTFDSEAAAIQAGVDDIMKEVGSWDNSFCEPNDGEFFNSVEEAADYFKKNKCVECTDQNSFRHVISVKRIRASEMPKLLEIVYAAQDEYDEPIQFDGNNIEAPSMYGFDAWDQILDLMA